ncbi:uncharacterized protein EDB93DRAFT_703569 [Suillus bovinus]|uniref:uncharacterized protein n=1 Tax=Suillus bovinus TaxID=48563 RepID=UPI001B87A620|nr:uncharacterized protein EDB93DRAFT_703569 [Suillus bovinus]KAG2139180.1 hypothetical protein EDB93DRAFT_703569 [Suillus bovinus]
MTIVSDDPIWWPTINASRFFSYFIVAAFVGVTYDWALTFGQEVELFWKQRWSLMTVLYLGVRYLGICFVALDMLSNVVTVSLTDMVSWIMHIIQSWMTSLAFAMLWVIMITRLYAMYQRSRKILIFLIVSCLGVNIFDGMVVVLSTMNGSGEELIFSGTYQCSIQVASTGDLTRLNSVNWILRTVWEVLTLCLAIWITVKQFRELRQQLPLAGGIIGDCFMVLMKTHVLYFASFVTVSCLTLISDFSPTPVCQSFTDLCICLCFIISIGHEFPRNSDF